MQWLWNNGYICNGIQNVWVYMQWHWNNGYICNDNEIVGIYAMALKQWVTYKDIEIMGETFLAFGKRGTHT